MTQVPPTPAAFIEERYIRDLFCSRLSTICATRAALPHVEAAQDFQAFVAARLPNKGEANAHATKVFELLNDDGQGVNNRQNTAVGYRLARAADLFVAISKLPADMLNLPDAAPVDMAARFTPKFADAQIKLDKRPKETGNYIQDIIAKLRHLQLTLTAIADFVTYPLEANAKIVYSDQTRAKYNLLRDELEAVLQDAYGKTVEAAKLVEVYADPADAAAIQAMSAETEEAQLAIRTLWQRTLAAEEPWWQALEADTPPGWKNVARPEPGGRWAQELRDMVYRIQRRRAGEMVSRE